MPRLVSIESLVAAARDQVSCALGDGLAILSLQTGVCYELDSVGADVWELIRGPRPVSEVRDLLLGQYGVQREQGEQDLLELMERLAAEGLIEVVDERESA